ncbi:MAG: hypothetical protein ACQESG_05140 [Nanobdellota archaeon]
MKPLAKLAVYLTLPLALSACSIHKPPTPVQKVSGIEELGTDFMRLQGKNHYHQRPDLQAYENLREKLEAYNMFQPSDTVRRMIATCEAHTYSFEGPRSHAFNSAIDILQSIQPEDEEEKERISGDIRAYKAARRMVERPTIRDEPYNRLIEAERERWDGSPHGFHDEMKSIQYQALLHTVGRNYTLKNECLEAILVSDYVADVCSDSFIAAKALALHAEAWERLADSLSYKKEHQLDEYPVNAYFMSNLTGIEEEGSFLDYLEYKINDTDILEALHPAESVVDAAYTLGKRAYQNILVEHGASRYADYAGNRLKALQEKQTFGGE